MGYSHFFLSFIFIGTFGHAQNSTTFEHKMNKIYKSSYSTEISDVTWGEYVSGLSTRSYSVDQGDTLWGLSEVFFGDGFFWSKIWSYNQSLTNPHFLKVGQKIQFFTGSVELPPSLSVDVDLPEGFSYRDQVLPQQLKSVEAIKKINKINKVTKTSSPQPRIKLYPGAPSIPPPKVGVRPVLKNLPSSFKSALPYDASKYDHQGMSFDLRPPIQVNPLFVAHSFLYGNKSENYPRVGELIESENGNTLVGLNEKVYIQSKEKLKLGEVFTVMGEDYVFDRNRIYASVIRYLAQVKIVKILPNERFQAEVFRSLSGIKSGSWITREKIPTFADDHSGRPSDKEFRIIGGGEDNISRIYGQSDVVYLQGGANNGVREGDILGVYKIRKIRYRNTQIEKSPQPIGHIKVFRAGPNLSSAFVVSSTEAILPGDATGEPTVVVDQTTQSERDDLDNLEEGLDFETETSKASSDSLEDELEQEIQ